MAFYSGQVLTADALSGLVQYRVSQGVDLARTSTTALYDTSIAVAVDGPAKIALHARYTSLAGGVRWAWSTSGTVTCSSRKIGSAGSATSSTDGAAMLAEMRWRHIATLTEEQLSAHITTSTANAIDEVLIVDGVGTLTFRIAQHTSNASATTLSSASYATIQSIEDQ